MKNMRTHFDSVSGIGGIRIRNGKYQVRIFINGKEKSFTFYTLEEALSKQKELRKINGYSENHGRIKGI